MDQQNRDIFEKKTRELFHVLHKAQSEDQQIFQRLTSLLTTDYLKVEKNYFQGKICLDAGCGSNANATYSMLEMGAEKVFAFDLDESIFETAPKMLQNFEGRYELRTGNVLMIDFKDDTFDFVHCGGVLHHSADLVKGLQELCRVTKPGGILYFHTYGEGGIIRDITSMLRKKYEDETFFKNLIDGLNAEQLRAGLTWLFSVMRNNDDEFGVSLLTTDLLEKLIDEDLVLTIRDRIAAPAYYEHSENLMEGILRDSGFSQVERLQRYPKFQNIRRFLSPIYFHYDNEISKLLYGSGSIQLKAVKEKVI